VRVEQVEEERIPLVLQSFVYPWEGEGVEEVDQSRVERVGSISYREVGLMGASLGSEG
jgi:hypothetical protein